MLYYPIYEITYYYKSKFLYTCLLDGVTGHIAGDRQFSAVKVTLASFLSFYPIVKIGVFSFGTLANLLFAFEIVSDLTFIGCLPMAVIIAPCIGLYVRSYPKQYKGGLNQIQWTEDHSKASKFTYNLLKVIEEPKFVSYSAITSLYSFEIFRNQSKLDSDQAVHVEKQPV